MVIRTEQRAARNAFNEVAKTICAERAATVKATVDTAVAETTAIGTDPIVARRVATRQAMQATKPEFDARMKAITETRRDAMAAAKAKSVAAKP